MWKSGFRLFFFLNAQCVCCGLRGARRKDMAERLLCARQRTLFNQLTFSHLRQECIYLRVSVCVWHASHKSAPARTHVRGWMERGLSASATESECKRERDAWGIRLRALDSLATLSRESSRGHAACVQPRLGTHTSIFIFYAEDEIPGSSQCGLRDENTHAPCAHVCLLCLSPCFSFCCAFGGREVILHHSTHTMPLFCSCAARVQI